MSLLTINKLTASVGAEVTGLDPQALAADDALATAVLDALEDSGVLVFPGLHLDPQAQVAFCRRLGDVDHSSDGHHPVAGIYPVTLDKSKNSSASYLRATFDWHIDGCTPTGDEFPQKATVLSALEVAERGGETEFASAYGAYDGLGEDEKSRLASLRVVHSLEASQRRVTPDPSPELLARWRSRPTHEHPWCGPIAAVVDRSYWARRRTTSSGWTSTRDGRCWPTCSTAPPAPTSSTATRGRWGTRSSGTTAGCCTGRRPTRRTHRGRCCAPPCSATNRSSDAPVAAAARGVGRRCP